MKLPALFVLIQIFCTACLAQNTPLGFGSPIPARANLDVRWNAPSDALPPALWVYRELRTQFSPAVISNLMALGSFTEKDKTVQGANTVVFESQDKARRLWINFLWGNLTYDDNKATDLSPTNLSVDLPDDKETLKLTRLFLQKMSIQMSDISKNGKSDEPRITFFGAQTMLYISNRFITNVPFHGVRFRRALDGAEVTGGGCGGDGQIEFGSHGKICEVDLCWRDVARDKLYQTATPETVVKWMREGKAVQNIIFTNISSIDWPTVKSVTVHNAYPAYTGPYRPASLGRVSPYVELDTTVDIGSRKINVELDCPIIDESKPLRDDGGLERGKP